MFEGYIYRHWLVNDEGVEKSYIGRVFNRKPEQRWGKNGKNYLGKNKNDEEKEHKMARAIKKYGWESFNHEILLHFSCETEKETNFWLNQWEKWYIEKYDSYYNGYNSTLGGEGCAGFTGLKGENNPMYGKHHTDDARAKMSKSQREYVSSENYMNPFQDKHHSEESKAKMSASVKEYYSTHEHPWTGKTHTEESKKKISDSKTGTQTLGDNPRARKCVCINTGQVFSCMEEAKQWCIGLTKSQPISWVCSGKRKSAGKHPVTGEKLHWMYNEDWLKLQENN